MENKKIIIGILFAVAVIACLVISVEVIGNISEQAYIAGYDSGRVMKPADGSLPEFILNTQFPNEKETIQLYNVKNTELNSEQIQSIAGFFDLKGDLKKYSENTGELKIVDDSYDPQRQISYYPKSGAIVYSIPDKEYPNAVEAQPSLPSRDEAIKIAESFVEKTNTSEEEGFVKNVEVNQKQQVWKSGAAEPEKSYDITTAVSYSRNLDGIPVYGDEFSVIIGDGGEVVGLVKSWREVEQGGFGRLKKAEDAYDDLCNRDTVNPLNLAEYDIISIDAISLGYWMEPRIYEQDEVKPVYVFSGTVTKGEKTDPYVEYVYALE